MKFSIIVQASPSSQSSTSALKFAHALLKQGHELFRVFFYADGVLVANNLITPPQDQTHLPKEWITLKQTYDLDLVVCIAAAVRRGILNNREATRYEKPASNLQEGFELSGLGQLAEAIASSDRVVTFGA